MTNQAHQSMELDILEIFGAPLALVLRLECMKYVFTLTLSVCMYLLQTPKTEQRHNITDFASA